jgi:parvulin-like peptidyl-prolyl isomerase
VFVSILQSPFGRLDEEVPSPMSVRRSRFGAGSLAAFGLSVFVVAATALVWRSEAASRTSAPAVAFVNGAAITAEDLDLRLSQILPQASYHGRLPSDRLASLKRAALDELVLDELIYREAIAAGSRPSPAAVDAEVASARVRFETADAFAEALRENGLDEPAFRERVGRAVLVRECRDDHSRAAVTEADIAAYYRDNGARFQRPEQVRLRQILFRVDPADPSTAAPAESKARAALARLLRGEPFGPLASRESEDEYRVKDGEMGFVHRGRLDHEFEEAVFATPVRRPSLARSLYGFEVFEVLERQPPAQLTYDEARPIIAGALERQRRSEGLRAWKARLLGAARVEVRDAALLAARPAELGDDGEASGFRSTRREAAGAAR